MMCLVDGRVLSLNLVPVPEDEGTLRMDHHTVGNRFHTVIMGYSQHNMQRKSKRESIFSMIMNIYFSCNSNQISASEEVRPDSKDMRQQAG